MSLFDSLTDPYSATESFAYDRWVAPAVAASWKLLADEIDAALPEGGALLDVGCGGGQNLLAVAGIRPDAVLTGLDLSPEQVRRARGRARKAGIAARFVEGSALSLPFGAEFDVVLSVASIKHWPEQRRGLSECVRVLRPGGQLLVIEADRGCRHEDVQRFVAAWPVPWPLRWAMLPLFRTWVAGRAIDLDDARGLLSGQDLEDGRVSRIEGTPALILRGRRSSDA